MTEQEYCDLSDLQICRAMLTVLSQLNAFESPNKERRETIRVNLRDMVKDLEPKAVVE